MVTLVAMNIMVMYTKAQQFILISSNHSSISDPIKLNFMLEIDKSETQESK
jgi:hypothetical protein